MDGLYLYCIREKTDGEKTLAIKGIDEENDIYILFCRELEAVVSKVPLEEFASSKIQKSAREDLNWIKGKAVIHGRVIDEAMKMDGRFLSLIPMRFGIIYKDETGLKASLEKNYDGIMGVLDKIRGKQEWGLKIFLENKEIFRGNIRRKNTLIKIKEAQISSLPEGTAYFMEEELKDIISKEVSKELDNITESIFEDLKKYAVNSTKCKILQKELTGKSETMVLNAAYLVSEREIGDFKKEVENLNHKIQAKGFSLRYSGPWPAYNFTTLEF
ncbi:MAG: GvpL/GvpF family gas vesicle protein [bacterium]|nr:GvpL/GvpF family gas vesicle protein [bacterium]